MSTEAPALTLREYATLDEPDETHVTELVRGVLIREPRPGWRHDRVQIRIASALDEWSRDVGAAVTTGSGFVLSEHPPTLRGPDVAVVLGPDVTVLTEGGWVRGAPDVAVEVLSPTESPTSVHRKTLDYLEADASLVWLVDPEAASVTIYRRDGSARLLRAGETLDGEDVLPGFSLSLDVLFDGLTER